MTDRDEWKEEQELRIADLRLSHERRKVLAVREDAAADLMMANLEANTAANVDIIGHRRLVEGYMVRQVVALEKIAAALTKEPT